MAMAFPVFRRIHRSLWLPLLASVLFTGWARAQAAATLASQGPGMTGPGTDGNPPTLSSPTAATAGQPGSRSAGETGEVQLVTVQMTLRLDDYWTREAFARRIQGLMDQVAARIDRRLPTVVAFPEDVGLMLAVQGLQKDLAGVTRIAQAIETATKRFFLPVAWTRLVSGLSWVPALYLYRHAIIAQTYFEVFSEMADRYDVYLVAGSVVLPPYAIRDGRADWRQGPLEKRVYNTAYLFGPDGKIIGKQTKVHLIDLEQQAALDLAHGWLDDLQVYDTPAGRIGIAICLDAFQDDVVSALAQQGAQILVQPSANPGPWSPVQQADWLNSSYRRTYQQGLFAYALNPMLNGPLWDIAFFGQSSIVARAPTLLPGPRQQLGYEALAPADGFIAVASSDRAEEILVARVPHPDRLAASAGH